MKRILRFSRLGSCLSVKVLPAIMSCIVAVAFLGAPALQAMPREASATSQTDSDEGDRIDIVIKNGYIYITSQRAVTVRLYTILGQLIMTHNIQPGTTRIKSPNRGVYILRAGTITRRLTIN